jgi:hypothetical protein
LYLHYERKHPDFEISICAIDDDGGDRELTALEKAAVRAFFDQADASGPGQ